MNVKRSFSIYSIIVFLSIVMFQFQNCAAPNTGDAESLSEAGTGPGFVDDINQKVAFIENLIVVKHDKGVVHFDGLCDRESDGKAVDWAIENASDREVALEGSSECIRGGFRITADQMNDLECGMDYDLIAVVEDFHDSVFIRKKCEPMATIEDRVEESLGGYTRECFFELETDENSGVPACYSVCYSSGKLYSRERAEINQCQN